jgi:hypothetical protein
MPKPLARNKLLLHKGANDKKRNSAEDVKNLVLISDDDEFFVSRNSLSTKFASVQKSRRGAKIKEIFDDNDDFVAVMVEMSGKDKKLKR